MPPPHWRRAWTRATWLRRLSGLTSPLLTVARGADAWISSLAGSPVRTSRTPGNEPGSTESGADCGSSTPGSSPRFALDTSSLRTSPRSSGAASIAFSPPLPRWGSMRSGVVSARPTWERRTVESESSFWPTPSASSYGTNQGGSAGRVGIVRASLETLGRTWPAGPQVPRNSIAGLSTCECARTLNPRFVESLMGWPEGWSIAQSDSVSSVTEWFRKWRLWLSAYCGVA